MKLTGYKGFGSFHSDNVEEMIRAIDSDIRVPIDESQLIAKHTEHVELGEPMKKNFFLDPDWTFINHGAFGATSRVAFEVSQNYALYAEQQPLRFIDRELFPFMVRSIRAMSKFVNVSPQDLVLVPNATYALNSVIRSWKIPKGSSVVFLDVGYGSVKKMLTEACLAAEANLVIISIKFPISGLDDIVAQVAESFPTDGSVSYAIFDHVTSNTGIVMPVRQLIEISHERGAKVLVDGAHGLQSQELDLTSLNPDWYTSNCHKWFCSTKGVAFLYSAPHVREATRSAIISHGYGEGYTSEFIWDGTRDYYGMISVPALLQWWEVVGHEKSRDYCRKLLKEAVELLVKCWNSETHVPMSCYSHMACVALPVSALPPSAYTKTPSGNIKFHATPAHSKMMQDTLHYNFNIECPVKTLGSRCYLRISAAIYNQLSDYQKLANAILSLTEDYWEQ